MELAIKKTELKKDYLPWEINKEGASGAAVLRYWGCSLSCPICYSQSYAYLNEGGSRKKVCFSLEQCETSIKNLLKPIGWTRIQGGEPLLDYDRAICTAKLCGFALKYMENNSPYDNPRVIIQTNGLWFHGQQEDKLNVFFEELLKQTEQNLKGRIAIELSFKGANKEVIKSYAYSLKDEGDALEIQKQAFYILKHFFEESIWRKTKRIGFYPVGGFGSQLNNPGFIPIDTKDDSEYPLFHPDTWSQDFKKIIEDFRKILKERKEVYADFIKRHDNKIPLECMEPSFFQKGWTAQIKKRKVLGNFLIKNLRIKNNPNLKIFSRELAQLNIPQASENLLSKIIVMKEHFYEAEPTEHYPYL